MAIDPGGLQIAVVPVAAHCAPITTDQRRRSGHGARSVTFPVSTRRPRLLRARREWPNRRPAAEQRDELATLHVSRATLWRSLSGWLAAHSGYQKDRPGPWGRPELF